MDIINLLHDLSSQSQFEVSEALESASPVCSTNRLGDSLNISHAVLPGGKRISLLKTLLTSACENDCFYCPFRAGRDFRRSTLSPDEMAKAFMGVYRTGIVQGLFLSSGVAGGGVRTQDKLIETVEIIREKYNYQGYIHLKIMPGSEYDQVLRTFQLADRISINLEAPNAERLVKLAPRKSFSDDLIKPMMWFNKIRESVIPNHARKGKLPSLTTQFVLGAVNETDLELLKTTERLIRSFSLKRAYYSAFSPVPDTPLEGHLPGSHVRECRLYQASFLLRDYGFTLEELPFKESGDLPTEIDPKLAWASANLQEEPIEINKAERWMLLRLPGVGPKSADAILSARSNRRIQSISDLAKMGIDVERLQPFILINGKKAEQQLSLWALGSF